MRFKVGVTLAVAITALVVANAASAATVSYIAGDSVWLSNIAGTQKKKLSGPRSDGYKWTEVAQSDNGKVLAISREPGKIAVFNRFTLFSPKGKVLQQGSLTNESGWVSSAFPVSLDLTNDGTAVYGYSNMNPGFPMGTFETGTYVRTVEKPYILAPFKIVGRDWPTLFGERVIAVDGSIVNAQLTGEQVPFGLDFTGFLQVPSGITVNRTDVAANGKLIGIELDYEKVEFYPIDQVADDGSDTTVGTGGCVLETQGEAGHVTISQDGKSIAWEDDRGVVTAGAPDFQGSDPCRLTRPPVALGANSGYPSIGAASLASDGGGDPGPTPILPGKIKAASLKKGIWIKVNVKGAGSVTVVGKVGRKVAARGNTKAKKAGLVKVRLRAVGAYRKKPQKLKGKTLSIKVTAGGKSKTVKRVLG